MHVFRKIVNIKGDSFLNSNGVCLYNRDPELTV